jgi:two-component system KDP operon response regulator KdpE
MKPNPIALIIDADRSMRRLLRVVLEPNHYKVYEAEDGHAALKEAVARRPDVIVLDLSLPGISGLAVLKRLREWNPAPVLILSDQKEEENKVAALDSGANDYMTKPFGFPELLARLRVLQRSIPGEPDGPLFVHGELRVDIMSHCITVSNRRVNLTPTEEAVFYILVRHAGKLVTCKHLIRCVWGDSLEKKIHDLHVYIRSLRQKLDGVGIDSIIQTEGGTGYRLLLPTGCKHLAVEPASLQMSGTEVRADVGSNFSLAGFQSLPIK